MNPTAVITGATGHVGFALLKLFQQRGEVPRILIRRDTPVFDGIPCEKVYGDVTDPASLQAAFAGMQTVYHLAGLIEVNPGHEAEIFRVNTQGTQNVIDACRACGIKRLVYTSSVDAYPPLPGNEIMREITQFCPQILDGTYAQSKAQATQLVLDAAKEGSFEAVIGYPSACIGPYDFRVSNIGEMVRMFMKGKFPVSLDFGAYNFVDVRDVAMGLLAAAEKGRNGEGYLLTGDSVSVDGLMHLLAEVCTELPNCPDRKAPGLCLPLWLTKAVAPLAEVYYNLAKATPLFTRYAVRKLESNCNFSHDKAKTELGYYPMSAKDSLRDMVRWILENQ